MKPHIKEISDQAKEAYEKYEKLKIALEALQNICDHKNSKYECHMHNDSAYICLDCGKLYYA